MSLFHANLLGFWQKKFNDLPYETLVVNIRNIQNKLKSKIIQVLAPQFYNFFAQLPHELSYLLFRESSKQQLLHVTWFYQLPNQGFLLPNYPPLILFLL